MTLDMCYITVMKRDPFEYQFTLQFERSTFFRDNPSPITQVYQAVHKGQHIVVTHHSDLKMRIYRDFKLVELGHTKVTSIKLLPKFLYYQEEDKNKTIKKLPLSNKFKTRLGVSKPALMEEF